MELVLPTNYVALDQEEMTYLDGGDWNNFRKNIEGLYHRSAGIRFALQASGLTSAAGKALYYSYPILMAKATALSVPVIAASGGLAALAVAGVGIALWNMRLFY